MHVLTLVKTPHVEITNLIVQKVYFMTNDFTKNIKCDMQVLNL